MTKFVKLSGASVRSVDPPYFVEMVSRHALRYSGPDRVVEIPIETGAQPWGIYLSEVRFWSVPASEMFSPEDQMEIGPRLVAALSFLGTRAAIE